MTDKDFRCWLGSDLYLLLMVSVVVFLTQVQIPPENRDIIVTVIGVMAGGVGAAVSRFVGRRQE